MPLWKFKCLGCKKVFDVFIQSQRLMQEAQHSCPDCSSKSLQRVYEAGKIDINGIIRQSEKQRRNGSWGKDGRNLV